MTFNQIMAEQEDIKAAVLRAVGALAPCIMDSSVWQLASQHHAMSEDQFYFAVWMLAGEKRLIPADRSQRPFYLVDIVWAIASAGS